MNTAKEKLPRKAANTSVSQDDQDFDFDLWAVQVKQQMLAALRRRGVRW